MNVFKTIIAAGCIALLAGCQAQEGAYMGVRVDDARQPNARIQYDQVVILDKVLQNGKTGKIAIEGQGASRTGTGTLKVTVAVRNRTDFPQTLDVRTSFFDSGFGPTEKPSGWTRLHLDPNGTGHYQESSMGAANVAHYYVEVREAR